MRTSTRCLLVLALLGLLAAPVSAQSNPCDVTAVSLTQVDVQTAINVATNGQTVCLRAGAATWTLPVTMTGKYLTLQGAGAGSTIITDGTTCVSCGSIMWTLDPGGLTRITGVTWQGGPPGVPDKNQHGMLAFAGDSGLMVIDHVTVNTTNTVGMTFSNYIRGVVADSTFTLSHFYTGATVFHNTWGNSGQYGDNSWATAAPLGTADAMYFENNTVGIGDSQITPFIDGEFGQRIVVRYSTFTNTFVANHGTETGGRARSGRSFEIYNNTFTYDQTFTDPIGLRGGTGVIYNNTITTTGGATVTGGISFAYYRYSDHSREYYGWGPWCGATSITSLTRSGSTATVTVSGGTGIHPSCSPGGGDVCYARVSGADQSEYNGTFPANNISLTQFSYTVSGTPATPGTGALVLTSPYDQNSNSTGYRCLDQPGAGTGDLISGDTPLPASWPNQALDPVYGWSNTKNGVAEGLHSNGADAIIILNRDYYDITKPGYTPYTYPHPLVGPTPPPPVLTSPSGLLVLPAAPGQ